LWRSTGGEIWVDPAVKLGHVGTMAYEGDPMAMLRAAQVEAA
jgi:hypothetical protein